MVRVRPLPRRAGISRHRGTCRFRGAGTGRVLPASGAESGLDRDRAILGRQAGVVSGDRPSLLLEGGPSRPCIRAIGHSRPHAHYVRRSVRLGNPSLRGQRRGLRGTGELTPRTWDRPRPPRYGPGDAPSRWPGQGAPRSGGAQAGSVSGVAVSSPPPARVARLTIAATLATTTSPPAISSGVSASPSTTSAAPLEMIG